MKRFLVFAMILAFVNGSAFAAAPANTASSGNDNLNILGRRAGVVGKSAVAGAAGGLIVGLASQAFKRETKNIFLCGSLGLYVGIAVGIYLVSAPRGSTPYEGPDTYEDYGTDSGQLEQKPQPLVMKPVTVEVPVVSLNF